MSVYEVFEIYEISRHIKEKVEVKADADAATRKCSKNERFVGQEMMEIKEEQMYLGDIISSDEKHDKNIQSRKNRGLGKLMRLCKY